MFCFFVIQVVILDLHLQCHSIAFFSFLCQLIVILVWDVLKNLKKCLPSLKMQKKNARLCQQQLSAWFQDGWRGKSPSASAACTLASACSICSMTVGRPASQIQGCAAEIKPVIYVGTCFDQSRCSGYIFAIESRTQGRKPHSSALGKFGHCPSTRQPTTPATLESEISSNNCATRSVRSGMQATTTSTVVLNTKPAAVAATLPGEKRALKRNGEEWRKEAIQRRTCACIWRSCTRRKRLQE